MSYAISQKSVRGAKLAFLAGAAAVALVEQAHGATLYVTPNNGASVATFTNVDTGATTLASGNSNTAFLTGLANTGGLWVDSAGDVYVNEQNTENNTLYYANPPVSGSTSSPTLTSGGSTSNTDNALYAISYNGYYYLGSENGSGNSVAYDSAVLMIPTSSFSGATPTPVASRVSGTGSDTNNAGLLSPMGMAVANHNGQEYLYVATRNNGGVGAVFAYPIESNGTLGAFAYSYTASTTAGATANFDNMNGLAVDQNGNVWISSNNSGYGLLELSPTLGYENQFDTGSLSSALTGLAVGPNNDLFVGDGSSILEVSNLGTTNTVTTYIGNAGFTVQGLAFQATATPEPSSLALLAAPALLMLKRRRRGAGVTC